MSEVKLSNVLTNVDVDSPSFPKPNPYLLQEFRTRIDKLAEAEKEVEYQKHLDSLPLEERKKLIEQKTKEEKAAKEAEKPASEPTEAEKKQQPKKKQSWGEWLIYGEEPETVIETAKKGVDAVKKVADAYVPESPITFSRVDPDQNRALREAEDKVHVEKFRMRKLLDQTEADLNPFSYKGKQIGEFGPYEKNERYDSRSIQESLTLLSTLLAVSNEISEKKQDPELLLNTKELASFLAFTMKLNPKEIESLGYTNETLTDEQLAEKWGLFRGKDSNVPGMGALKQGGLPEMFFQVQQLITSYNVLSTLDGAEKELSTLLKNVELDSTLSTEAEKAAKRREIWSSVLKHRFNGALKQGDELDGVRAKVEQHLYGAAIYAPLLLSSEEGLSLGEATVFRLLAEKHKKQANTELAEEQTYRITNAYSLAEKEGKIRDLVESTLGKKVDQLSIEEIEEELQKYKKNSANDYLKAESLYGQISKNLPAFIELRRAVDLLPKTSDAPAVLDTAAKNPADFDILVKEIRAARVAAEKTINETLQLKPDAAVAMAEEFVRRNQGNLSQEASQIPQLISMIAERVYGYKK